MPKCKKVTTSSEARQESYRGNSLGKLHIFDLLFFFSSVDQFLLCLNSIKSLQTFSVTFIRLSLLLDFPSLASHLC